MTNGEKLQEIFNVVVHELGEGMTRFYINGIMYLTNTEWWNAKYKKPTTKNDLGVEGVDYISRAEVLDLCDSKDPNYEIRHLKEDVECLPSVYPMPSVTPQEPTTKNDLVLIHTEGLDEGIRCAMCTNSMKSDKGCDGSCIVNNDMYKAVMNAIEKHIQSTTKNDLGVDCVSRQAVDRLVYEYLTKATDENIAFYEHFLDLPSITPQEPRWIPITERLPDNSGRYLVNYSSGYVSIAHYYESVSKWGCTTTERIVKWMPLPESYREVSE